MVIEIVFVTPWQDSTVIARCFSGLDQSLGPCFMFLTGDKYPLVLQYI